MSVNSEEYIRDYANRMAPLSHRQVPVFSQVGKGLRGDASVIEYDEAGAGSMLKCKYLDQLTGEESILWELRIADIMPRLHYQVIEGVRVVDDVPMWGYYIKYTAYMATGDVETILWVFDTPFATTHPFRGTDIPEDRVIDHD